MIARLISSVVGVYGLMVGLRALPITIFMLIINTSTFITAILQYFRLGKVMTSIEIVSMIGCYIGIVCIALGSSKD